MLHSLECWFHIFFLLQILLRSGRNPDEALMILVPEGYKNHPTLSIKYPEVTFSSDLKHLLFCSCFCLHALLMQICFIINLIYYIHQKLYLVCFVPCALGY